MTETTMSEDGGKWLPDLDMIFEIREDGYVSPIETADLNGRKLLDEVRDDFVTLRTETCK